MSIGSCSVEQFDRPVSLRRALGVNCAVIAGTVPGMVIIMQTLQSIFALSLVPPPADASTFVKIVLTFAVLGVVCWDYPKQRVVKGRYNYLLYLCVGLHLGALR